MASNTLSKITARAKQIRKAKPKMAWTAAVKEAGAEYRSGKLTGAKKKKVGDIKTVAKRVHKAAKSAAKSVKSHYDLHKQNSRARLVEKCKSISGVKSDGLSLLNEKYGKLATKKLNAKGVREKRKVQKDMTATAAQIRKIKSL